MAGDNITISGNVISAVGGGSGTTYTAGDGIDITNNVITNTAITTVDQTLNSGSTNAISNAVVTNTFNNYMLKNQIWCGDYTEWSQISGSTQNDVLYLIHQ